MAPAELVAVISVAIVREGAARWGVECPSRRGTSFFGYRIVSTLTFATQLWHCTHPTHCPGLKPLLYADLQCWAPELDSSSPISSGFRGTFGIFQAKKK